MAFVGNRGIIDSSLIMLYTKLKVSEHYDGNKGAEIYDRLNAKE